MRLERVRDEGQRGKRAISVRRRMRDKRVRRVSIRAERVRSESLS